MVLSSKIEDGITEISRSNNKLRYTFYHANKLCGTKGIENKMIGVKNQKPTRIALIVRTVLAALLATLVGVHPVSGQPRGFHLAFDFAKSGQTASKDTRA